MAHSGIGVRLALTALSLAGVARLAAAGCVDLEPFLKEAERVGTPSAIVLADPSNVRLLRTGWAVPEKWDAEPDPAIWADGPRSVLAIPLASPVPLRMVLRAAPYVCEGCRDLQAQVRVNGTRIANLYLAPGFHDYAFDVPRDVLRYRDNHLSLRWSELRIPAEHERGSQDRRTLAAAVSRLTLEPKDPDAARQRAALEPPLMRGREAAALYVALPESGRLEGAVRRRGDASRFGAAATARISLRTEGEGSAEEDLWLGTLSAFSTATRPFSIDLSRHGGKVVRLSLRVEGSPDLVASWEGLSLCTDAPFDAPAAFGGYRARPVQASTADLPCGRPNAIVYLMDALRARDLGCYGDAVAMTPFVDRLSRAAILFESNVSQASSTAPSVKALVTARYLPLTDKSVLAPEEATLGAAFRRAGYATSAFSSSPWPELLGALRHVETVPRDAWYVPLVRKDFASVLTDWVARWAARAGSPFYSYVHSIHPHNPYEPFPPWSHAIPPEPSVAVSGSSEALIAYQDSGRAMSRPELEELHRLYRLDVAYNDHEIARLVRHLDRLGLWDATGLLIVADHGDELGEHGGLLHGYTSYEELLHVPAILRVPGTAAALVASRTETVDLGPTLLDFAGIPPLPTADGASLRPLCEGRQTGRRRAYSSSSAAPGIYTVIDRASKYVYAPRNGLEVGVGIGAGRSHERFYLYDLEHDPGEQRNLVDDDPVLAAYLSRCLQSWLTATADIPGSRLATPETPEDVMSLLRSLGYVEGPSAAPVLP
ncbi:MAG: sulfatase [Acidobacteriota bacterium]